MAVEAECEVVVVFALNIQPVRIVETFSIAICRSEHECHPLTSRDGNFGELNLSDGSAWCELYGGIKPKQLFDGSLDKVRIFDQVS